MNIKETISTINEMQAEGIIGKYAIGGAVGATFYIEMANTEDIDVFVVLNPQPGRLIVTLEDIHLYLEGRGCSVDREGYSIIAGWKVQFLPADKPLLIEALDQSVEKSLDGLPVFVFTVEHLAAISVSVGRPKDRSRIVQFSEFEGLNKKLLSEILSRHGLLDEWVRLNKLMTG